MKELAHERPPGLGPFERMSSYAEEDVDNVHHPRSDGGVPSYLNSNGTVAGYPIMETMTTPGESPVQARTTREIGPLYPELGLIPNKPGFRYRARFDGV